MSRPQDDAGTANPFDPFGQWKSLRDATLEAWSKQMIDFVHSEDYSRASAQWLDASISLAQVFQQAVEQTLTRTLTQYNIPTAGEVVKLAERLTNIELRLDDLDARLDEIVRLLTPLSSSATAAERPAAAPKGRGRAEARPAPDDAPRPQNGEAGASPSQPKDQA